MSGRGPNPIIVKDGKRRCIECKEWKPIEVFPLLTPAARKKTRSTDRNGRCHPCHLAWRRAYRKRRPEVARKIDRKQALKQYGITEEDYQRMYVKQDGLCGICKKPETALGPYGEVKLLAVDHCHETNVVRGLLCQACNMAIGQFKHDPALLRAGIAYLAGNVNTVGAAG